MATPLKYTAEGIPKNWDGKDWQTYKWAMRAVFRENDLLDIVERKAKQDETADVTKEQNKIMRMIGMSVPPEILHQIRDKDTGSDMWGDLCDLFENKINKTVKVHNIRRLVDELWSMKFAAGGDANLHLCKMFNIRTELASLQYTVDDIDMVEMLLESLPDQAEFETLKASIRYCADTSVYTPTKVRELIRAAASRQSEFRSKRSGSKRGHQKSGGQMNEDKSQSENQQQSKSKMKHSRKCYICGCEDHLRANCPDNTKKTTGADARDSEQKRNPRGNCTIRQKNSAKLETEHTASASDGVVAGAQ
ncbi:hypothetical protein PRNP1_003381 [Phytophthora ramorum]